jgi:hypothetical protein
MKEGYEIVERVEWPREKGLLHDELATAVIE